MPGLGRERLSGQTVKIFAFPRKTKKKTPALAGVFAIFFY
jgi:hypothetical protein